MPIIVPRNQFNLLRIDSVCSASEIEAGISKDKACQSQVAPPPPRRRVVFNRDVYVQETIHVNNYTDDEMDATWYTKEDFKDQKAEFAITVRLIVARRLTDADDDVHCARGLEYRHREGAKARQENKLKGLMSVLEEQERQQVAGEENDEKIRRAYISANQHCRSAAYELGLCDEEAAFGPYVDVTFSNSSHSSSENSEHNGDVPSKNKGKVGLSRFFGRGKQ